MWAFIYTLRQLLSIRDCTTRGLFKTQLYRNFYTCIILICPLRWQTIDHKALPVRIFFIFVLKYPNLQTAGFGFTFNSANNLPSDFFTIGFFSVINVITSVGMLSARPLGVDTISASRIALYRCWFSHFPADLYNLFIFSKNMCS